MNDHQAAVLHALEPQVEGLIITHLATRKNFWMPRTVLVPNGDESEPERFALLRQEAATIPLDLRAVFVLNGLTEAGLPHFHRLLATHLGEESHWRRWTDLWTAEEDRHDGLLHDLLRCVQFVDIEAVESLQYQYLLSGFRPDWQQNPYKLISYTTLQEQATQISHGNEAQRLKRYAPECTAILSHIPGEEWRHATVYSSLLGHILSLDTDAALVAFWEVANDFSMPGVAMPGYEDLSYIAQWAGVFGPRDYAGILKRTLTRLRVSELSPRTDAGKEAQELILAKPTRLERLGELAELRKTKRGKRTISLSFLQKDIVL